MFEEQTSPQNKPDICEVKYSKLLSNAENTATSSNRLLVGERPAICRLAPEVFVNYIKNSDECALLFVLHTDFTLANFPLRQHPVS